MNKAQALEKIGQEIMHCKICQLNKSGLPVVGEGDPDAKIMFIGEAPGKEEAKTGRPFIGRSGKLLRSMIREVGLKEEGVYITSPVKYLPDSGTPNSEEITHGRKHLNEQIEVIKPLVIVLLGRVAAEAVLEEKLSVMKEHGKILQKDNRQYFLTIHPAAAVRFFKNRAVIKADFQKLKEIVDNLEK